MRRLEPDCVPCAAGKYSSSEGAFSASVCLDCPVSAYSDPGSDSYEDCTCVGSATLQNIAPPLPLTPDAIALGGTNGTWNFVRNVNPTWSAQDAKLGARWVLVFRQTFPFVFSSDDAWAQARSVNTDDDSQPNYSILNSLEKFRSSNDQKLKFMLKYPQNFPHDAIVFKQSSNPVTSTSRGVTGLESCRSDHSWSDSRGFTCSWYSNIADGGPDVKCRDDPAAHASGDVDATQACCPCKDLDMGGWGWIDSNSNTFGGGLAFADSQQHFLLQANDSSACYPLGVSSLCTTTEWQFCASEYENCECSASKIRRGKNLMGWYSANSWVQGDTVYCSYMEFSGSGDKNGDYCECETSVSAWVCSDCPQISALELYAWWEVTEPVWDDTERVADDSGSVELTKSLADGHGAGDSMASIQVSTCESRVYVELDMGRLLLLEHLSWWMDWTSSPSYCNQLVTISASGEFIGEEQTAFACGTYAECGVEASAGHTISLDPTVMRYVRFHSSRSEHLDEVRFSKLEVVGSPFGSLRCKCGPGFSEDCPGKLRLFVDSAHGYQDGLALEAFSDAPALPGLGSNRDECAAGYSLLCGSKAGWGYVNGRGGGMPVSSCRECASLCDANSMCLSYECSNQLPSCQLNTEQSPDDYQYYDTSFCSRDLRPPASASVSYPSAIAVAPDSRIFIAEFYRIRSISLSDGATSTIAGMRPGYQDGKAMIPGFCTNFTAYGSGQALFNAIIGLAVTIDNSFLLIAEQTRIRRVNLGSGDVVTLAGSYTHQDAAYMDGLYGYMDGYVTGSACADLPGELSGTTWSDGNNACQQYADAEEVALGWCDLSGDTDFNGEGKAKDKCCVCGGGELDAAVFESINGISVTRDGMSVLVTDAHRIKSVKLATGEVTVLAGSKTGTRGSSDGYGEAATFSDPAGIAVTANGDTVIIVDSANHIIRALTIATGEVRTLAGSGIAGYRDDTARMAMFRNPNALAISPGGTNVLVTDGNHIRVVSLETGDVSTLDVLEPAANSSCPVAIEQGVLTSDASVSGSPGNTVAGSYRIGAALQLDAMGAGIGSGSGIDTYVKMQLDTMLSDFVFQTEVLFENIDATGVSFEFWSNEHDSYQKFRVVLDGEQRTVAVDGYYTSYRQLAQSVQANQWMTLTFVRQSEYLNVYKGGSLFLSDIYMGPMEVKAVIWRPEQSTIQIRSLRCKGSLLLGIANVVLPGREDFTLFVTDLALAQIYRIRVSASSVCDCNSCEAGKYSSLVGTTSCASCPGDGASSPEQSVSLQDCTCRQGYAPRAGLTLSDLSIHATRDSNLQIFYAPVVVEEGVKIWGDASEALYDIPAMLVNGVLFQIPKLSWRSLMLKVTAPAIVHILIPEASKVDADLKRRLLQEGWSTTRNVSGESAEPALYYVACVDCADDQKNVWSEILSKSFMADAHLTLTVSENSSVAVIIKSGECEKCAVGKYKPTSGTAVCRSIVCAAGSSHQPLNFSDPTSVQAAFENNQQIYAGSGVYPTASMSCTGSCGCQTLSRVSAGTLSDGDGAHYAYDSCAWIIALDSSDASARLTLQFSAFSLHDNDYVRISNCSTRDCYDSTQIAWIPSNSVQLHQDYLSGSAAQNVKVDFTANSRSKYYDGFQAMWAVDVLGYQGPCTLCAAGQYAEEDGATACTKCESGKASVETGASHVSACMSCLPGSVNPRQGATQCTNCSAGTYAAMSEQTACAICAAGYYQNTMAASTCVLCDAGATSLPGSTAKEQCVCAPGTQDVYTDAGGKSCALCEAGKSGQGTQNGASTSNGGFSGRGTGSGSGTGTGSDAGTGMEGVYVDVDNSQVLPAECVLCDVGKFAVTAGLSVCTECASGTFQDKVGAESCQSCQTGKSSSAGSHRCVCAEGLYSSNLLDTDAECLLCEPGKYKDVPGLLHSAAVSWGLAWEMREGVDVYDGATFESGTHVSIEYKWSNTAYGISIEYHGLFMPTTTGWWAFGLASDGSSRFFLTKNSIEVLVVDNTADMMMHTSGQINLVAGVIYSVRLEYTHRYGGLTFRFTMPFSNGGSDMMSNHVDMTGLFFTRSDGNTSLCSLCPVGKFSAEGASICTSCPFNASYAPAGSVRFEDCSCPLNSSWVAGSAECLCNAGFVQTCRTESVFETLSEQLYGPCGIAATPDGVTAFITEQWGHRIRMIVFGISTSISTLAGGGQSGYADGYGTNVRFNEPTGIVLTPNGARVLVADRMNGCIRSILISNGQVSTLNLHAMPEDDDSDLFEPEHIAITPDGHTVVVAQPHWLRLISLETGEISTLAGSRWASSYSDGYGMSAQVNYPTGIAISHDGQTAYVADSDIQMQMVIRTITMQGDNTGEVKTLTTMRLHQECSSSLYGVALTPNYETLLVTTEAKLYSYSLATGHGKLLAGSACGEMSSYMDGGAYMDGTYMDGTSNTMYSSRGIAPIASENGYTVLVADKDYGRIRSIDVSESCRCSMCDSGKYSNPLGPTSCSTCPVGKVLQGLSCGDCPAGKYITTVTNTFGEFMFDMTEFHSSNFDYCAQMAELRLFDQTGAILQPNSVTPTPGARWNPLESPDNFEDVSQVFDGSIDTKWCDQSRQGDFIFSFSAPVTIALYEWVTANDGSDRDPVSWILKGRHSSGSEWVIIHQVSQATVTTSRRSLVGPFDTITSSNYSMCTDCGAGKYSNEGAVQASDCIVCQQGKYAASSGAQCATCPSGSYANAASAATSCLSLQCSAGLYLRPCTATVSDISSLSSPDVQETPASEGTIALGSADYDNNAHRDWLISSVCGHVVLTFNSFDTQQDSDYVTLNECADEGCSSQTEIARLHRNAVSNNISYVSTTGYLQVVFTSDSTVTGHGFVATWEIDNKPIFGRPSARCAVCPNNTVSPDGSTSIFNCTCKPGFLGVGDGEECAACPAGKYQNKFGSTVCEECGTGSHSTPGSSVCLCDAGHRPVGDFSCVPCQAGTYLSQECAQTPVSATNCTCTVCKPGYYADTTMATVCTSCPPGTYQNASSASACQQCATNTSSPAASTSNAACLCGEGFFTSGSSSVCIACGPGTVSTVLGSVSCLTCQEGTYSSEDGSACITCPNTPELYSPTGSSTASDCSCPPNHPLLLDGQCACENGQFEACQIRQIDTGPVVQSLCEVSLVSCPGDSSSTCPSQGIRQGNISDGPYNYNNGANMQWIISSDCGEVQLSFDTFDTESDFDFVRVYECDTSTCDSARRTEKASLSGSSAGGPYASSTGVLQVVFTSDGSVVKSGFTATWTVVGAGSDSGSSRIYQVGEFDSIPVQEGLIIWNDKGHRMYGIPQEMQNGVLFQLDSTMYASVNVSALASPSAPAEVYIVFDPQNGGVMTAYESVVVHDSTLKWEDSTGQRLPLSYFSTIFVEDGVFSVPATTSKRRMTIIVKTSMVADLSISRVAQLAFSDSIVSCPTAISQGVLAPQGELMLKDLIIFAMWVSPWEIQVLESKF